MPTSSADGARPPLHNILHTLPSPLIVVLVGLASPIARIRRVFEILAWRCSWQDSCLALALLWAVCLFSDVFILYALPLVVCAVLFLSRTRRATVATTSLPPPATEDTLLQTINDLSSINSLLLSFSIPSLSALTSSSSTTPTVIPIAPILRTLIFLYAPYLLLTHFVRLRILVALAGTIVLVWRARWVVICRRALTRSAYLRWVAYRAYSLLTGLPSPISPNASLSSASSKAASLTPTTTDPTAPTTTLRFLFTLYENQRWWVGLDFTAALLPGERPSWSTSPPTLLPVSPPAAFTLPPPTTVYLPDPESKDGKGRIKRTARWGWEEGEWRVIVRTPANGGTGNGSGSGNGNGSGGEKGGVKTERVERPLPSLLDEGGPVGAGTAAGRILSKMRQASLSGSIGGGSSASLPPSLDSGGSPERHARSPSQTLPLPSGHSHDPSLDSHTPEKDSGANSDAEDRHSDEEEEKEEPCTDPDGWVYGDNKWETLSARGGMGKYTRFRRWTRVAVLCEWVERVGEGEACGQVGVVRRDGGEQWVGPNVNVAGSTAAGASLGKRASLGVIDTGFLANSPTSPGAGAVASPLSMSATLPGTDTAHTANAAGTSANAGAFGASANMSTSTATNGTTTSAEDDRNRLRQRLRAAVRGVSGAH